jgi:hypothetical protein
MGNSSSSAFDSGEAITYTGNGHWTLNQGSRKVTSVEEVFVPDFQADSVLRTFFHFPP